MLFILYNKLPILLDMSISFLIDSYGRTIAASPPQINKGKFIAI